LLEKNLTTLTTDLKPIMTYHRDYSKIFLTSGENLFVKEMFNKLWKKSEYRLSRLEENVFDGSDELSSAHTKSSRKFGSQDKEKEIG